MTEVAAPPLLKRSDVRRSPRTARAAWVFVVVGCASGCTSRGPAVGPVGKSPIALHAFWDGLPPASSRAPARDHVALRPPIEGRVAMPGGSFVMGSSPEDLKRALASCQSEQLGALCDDERVKITFLAEAPAHGVTLSAYAIDRTEVTVAAYARCVAVGACVQPARGTHDARFDRPELPVTSVDWDAATAFCVWAGGRLPTEAEWELAARGTEQRTYPWGDVYNPYLANHGGLATDPLDATDGFTLLAPVGSFLDGATPTGLLDMAGNVAEWVYDFYDVNVDGFGYDAASQVNPTGPKFGLAHVVRGGSYSRGAAWLRGASRAYATGPSPDVGFRCAADVR